MVVGGKHVASPLVALSIEDSQFHPVDLKRIRPVLDRHPVGKAVAIVQMLFPIPAFDHHFIQVLLRIGGLDPLLQVFV